MKSLIKVLIAGAIVITIIVFIPDLALPLFTALDNFLGSGIVILVQSVYAIIPADLLTLGAMQFGVLGIRLLLAYAGLGK
ncbi:MAG: hypothetical protein WC088_05970 [Candidatus Izemoplasmatales bacterium]